MANVLPGTVTLSESIRGMIKVYESRSKTTKKSLVDHELIGKEEPLGIDRDKNRIWAFDREEDSSLFVIWAE
jgi:hypothetical protein